uniref:Homeobox domain-containing protein n=1 Tax=Latimeria chalumnae TaxID=7897 RepID=H3BCZ2_LATCH
MARWKFLLEASAELEVPWAELVELSGQICTFLQDPQDLERFLTFLLKGKHSRYFLQHDEVFRAQVVVHMRRRRYHEACKVLEGLNRYSGKLKEEMVELWNEIHYIKERDRIRRERLSPVQKFRCRKRNPPPASLCPKETKSRNYPSEVQNQLRKFAVEVTAYPNKKQREKLCKETRLKPNQIRNWFVNFRRKKVKERFRGLWDSTSGQ